MAPTGTVITAVVTVTEKEGLSFFSVASLWKEPEIIKSLEGDGNKGRVADRIVCPAGCWERNCPD